ncbi:MAG: hypothetical protein J5477_06560, partial [Schwartzia sp.]|nr:hypothetical protein [Schwartzia sp. (in: firmicutes)]
AHFSNRIRVRRNFVNLKNQFSLPKSFLEIMRRFRYNRQEVLTDFLFGGIADEKEIYAAGGVLCRADFDGTDGVCR